MLHTEYCTLQASDWEYFDASADKLRVFVPSAPIISQSRALVRSDAGHDEWSVRGLMETLTRRAFFFTFQAFLPETLPHPSSILAFESIFFDPNLSLIPHLHPGHLDNLIRSSETGPGILLSSTIDFQIDRYLAESGLSHTPANRTAVANNLLAIVLKGKIVRGST